MKLASLSSLDTNWRIWESEETNLPGDISRKEIIARNESPLLFLGGFCSIKTGSKQAIHQYESDFHISFWLKWFDMIKTLSELHKMKPAKLEWNYHYHYSIAIIIIIPDLSCTFFQPSFLHQLPLAAQISLNSLTFELLNVSFSLALLATDRQRVTCGIHLTTTILGYPLVHL